MQKQLSRSALLSIQSSLRVQPGKQDRANILYALQVIKRPHWLLVTLVLVNAAATEVQLLRLISSCMQKLQGQSVGFCLLSALRSLACHTD